MTKLMKIKSLKNYGIPSYILNIWEKHYSPYLLPIQEEAVRDYGILEEENKNLLVIAPTSSGKTFIGEMAAITQVIHQKKVIYLVPLRCLTEEKYRHFKNLYSNWGLETVVSTRARREDDHRIIQGNYKIAVMVYEKFYYFLLKHPNFLIDVSLVIIDEMQMINHPKWGPLMENLIDHLRKKNGNLKIIALSALIENQEALLKWFPAQSLICRQRPVELRKGVVREGIFKYITSKKKKTYQREIFFKKDAVRDNCFGDYLLETVRYFIKQNESTLIFFSTGAETRQWAKWLASRLESSATSSAIGELAEMEDTLSKDELLELLPKGIVYHNRDLSWEERNLVETYLKKGEIKVICATNILAMGISLPFKNVIISLDKIHNGEEDDRYIYRTGLTFADIENMGGRTGILNIGKEGNYVQNGREFGRVIFLAHSLFFETIYQKLYFNYLQNNSALQVTNHLVKKEKDLLTFLLRLLVNHKDEYSSNKIKQYLREISVISACHQSKTEEENNFSGYWRFDFDKDNIEKEIDYCLDLLVKNRLITEEKSGILSPTINGVLVIAKGIKVETYLYFKNWMKNSKKGEISDLELLVILSVSRNGKDLPIPCSQSYRNDDKRGESNHEWEQEEIYWHKILGLIFGQGEGNKEIYQDKFILKEGEEETSTLEDYLSCKKTLLLYDWIKGNKEMKSLEQEYFLYEGDVLRLAEGFCWLADSLGAVAEDLGWSKKENKKEELAGIKILSERLAWGVEEEGLKLACLHIPGLSRSYIRALLREGYDDEKYLQELSEEELAKVVPKRLAERIKRRFSGENCKTEDGGLEDDGPTEEEGTEDREDTEDREGRHKVCPYMKDDSRNFSPVSCNLQPETGNFFPASGNPQLASCIFPHETPISRPHTLNTNDQRLTTILEISLHRPDRILFEGKEVKVTTIGFSLIYLLAQHRGQVVSYENILKKLWKEEDDAIYTRINYHICKIKKDISKAINNKSRYVKKIENIFKTVPGRGIMLGIKEKELETNF